MGDALPEAPVNETKAMAHDGYTEPVRVTREPAKRDYSDDPAMTGKVTHRHRFSKEGTPVGHRMVGRMMKQIYRYPCTEPGCKETKVE